MEDLNVSLCSSKANPYFNLNICHKTPIRPFPLLHFTNSRPHRYSDLNPHTPLFLLQLSSQIQLILSINPQYIFFVKKTGKLTSDLDIFFHCFRSNNLVSSVDAQQIFCGDLSSLSAHILRKQNKQIRVEHSAFLLPVNKLRPQAYPHSQCHLPILKHTLCLESQ